MVIITGCFSYYQVSVPAFNTLNKIPNIKGIYIFFCNPSGYMQNLHVARSEIAPNTGANTTKFFTLATKSCVEEVYGDYRCM